MQVETATERARRLGREIMDAELRKRGLLREPEPIRKQAAPQPTAAELRERIAKLERDTAATLARLDETRAERRVDEVVALLAKSAGGRDREALDQAGVLLRDPATDAAYYARVRGERYEAPVAKAAEPDRRAEIRKLLTEGDHAGLGELLRAGAPYEQYLEVANEPATLAATAEVRKAGGEADVKRKLLDLHAKLDGNPAAARELAALRRTPEGQKAWQALVAEGKVKVPA